MRRQAMHVIEASSAGKPSVLIEVDDVTVVPIGREAALEGALEGRTEDAVQKLREIGDSIGEVCASVREAVVQRIEGAKPDEFVLEFGVKVAAEGSAIISKVSGEAAIKVTATWRTETPPAS
jgi:hypothetical protein